MLCHTNKLVANPVSRWSATLGTLPSEQASIQGLPGLHLTLQNRPNNVCNAKEPYLPCFFPPLDPYFPAVRFIKLQRPKKKDKLPRWRRASHWEPASLFPSLNCSTSFEATEIA